MYVGCVSISVTERDIPKEVYVKKFKVFIGLLGTGALVLIALNPLWVSAGEMIRFPFIIAADQSLEEITPAIAYNSSRQEYLVVWSNDRAGCDDIQAQRVSWDGALLGGAFYIAAGCPEERTLPDVAYDSQNDLYLVVWQEYDPSNGYSIKASRVSGSGGAYNEVLEIRSYGYNLYTPQTPAVAYAFTVNKFLVVWAETWHPLPIIYSIYGQIVNPSTGVEGSRFVVSEGSESRKAPDVAYNRHANRYLVVWQQDMGLWDIHGQQVKGGGGTYKGDITIAYYTVDSTAPAVAAIPTTADNYKFLVVWEANLSTHRDIYGRLISEEGDLHPNALLIGGGGADQFHPDLAGSELGDRYLVTWREDPTAIDKDIVGRVVNWDNTLAESLEIWFNDCDYPAVAAGPYGDFLIAVQEKGFLYPTMDIRGIMWGNRIYLPMLVR